MVLECFGTFLGFDIIFDFLYTVNYEMLFRILLNVIIFDFKNLFSLDSRENLIQNLMINLIQFNSNFNDFRKNR